MKKELRLTLRMMLETDVCKERDVTMLQLKLALMFAIKTDLIWIDRDVLPLGLNEVFKLRCLFVERIMEDLQLT